MALGETIHTLLNGVTTKNYPLRAPQTEKLPYVLYAELVTEPTIVKDSVSHLDTCTYQVSSFAQSYSAVKTLAASIRLALDGYKDSLIDNIIFENDFDIYEEDTGAYHIAQEYRIRLRRIT